jgi:hypothetical protein
MSESPEAQPAGYRCRRDPACRVLVWPWRDHSVRCAEANAGKEEVSE